MNERSSVKPESRAGKEASTPQKETMTENEAMQRVAALAKQLSAKPPGPLTDEEEEVLDEEAEQLRRLMARRRMAAARVRLSSTSPSDMPEASASATEGKPNTSR